jgi:L-alanine-DL-glutamate epimerase-like enolase superfamily enzyme
MRSDRRSFVSALAASWLAGGAEKKVIPWYEEPMFNLPGIVPRPVIVKRIDLLRIGPDYFVRATSADGLTGIVRTKQISDYVAILQKRVIPYFLNKDARDLETLIDEVYIANYKLAGQAFWCPVAYVEQAIFDLLGKTADKPVGALLGGVVRKRIPVYLSGSIRTTKAEEEVDIYVRGIEETGAKACKFKIGGRMSRNVDVYPGRTGTLMKLARRRLGDKVIINADANGSYSADKAIEVGRMLESLGCGFFEEPCPWEELGETKKVADALKMPVAAGEQDASLWRFLWMIETKVCDIVQPDINYHGGFIRTCRVARMARRHGIPIVPHNTQTGASAVNIVQFASSVPNIGGYMEYEHRGHKPEESWYTPQFRIRDGFIDVPGLPGLGIQIDPAFLKKAEIVTA